MLICSTTATTTPASKYRQGLVAKFSTLYFMNFQQQLLQQVNVKKLQKLNAGVSSS